MLFAPKRQPRQFKLKSRFSHIDEGKKPYNIEFQRKFPGSAKNRRAILYFILVCLIVIYLLIFFRKFSTQPTDIKFEVEDINVK